MHDPSFLHVQFGDNRGDMKLQAGVFSRLPAEIRDLLFAEYIEEITAQVVGAENVVSFFISCFQGQDYELTHLGDTNHALWDYIDHSKPHDEL